MFLFHQEAWSPPSASRWAVFNLFIESLGIRGWIRCCYRITGLGSNKTCGNVSHHLCWSENKRFSSPDSWWCKGISQPSGSITLKTMCKKVRERMK
jgi:hypothetical protein